MNHAMVDIETLDTKRTAVVLSIGICRFGMDTATLETRTCYLSVQPQIDAGRTISADTLAFWAEQDPELFDQQLTGTASSGYQTGLEVIDHLGSADHVWACDPDFDILILNDLFGAGICSPFATRSFRTIRHMARAAGIDAPERVSAAHDAGADAEYQARCVQRWWPALVK